jgi:putative FmdB family regulatory protein
MPIYEFHCKKCGKDSELLVRTMDWKNSECPHCGSKKLTKKLSTFASSGAASPDKSGGGGHSCSGGGCGCH